MTVHNILATLTPYVVVLSAGFSAAPLLLDVLCSSLQISQQIRPPEESLFLSVLVYEHAQNTPWACTVLHTLFLKPLQWGTEGGVCWPGGFFHYSQETCSLPESHQLRQQGVLHAPGLRQPRRLPGRHRREHSGWNSPAGARAWGGHYCKSQRLDGWVCHLLMYLC